MAPLAGPVTWCSGEHHRKSTLNWRLFLRGGVVGLHPGERLFHFAEDPNRVGNQIRRTIAFEPRDQLSLKSQDSPLRELHQAGDADSDRPVASRPTTPELIDEEVLKRVANMDKYGDYDNPRYYNIRVFKELAETGVEAGQVKARPAGALK